MSPLPGPSYLRIFEHSFYIGSYLGGILYGVNLTVYFLIMQGLWNSKHPSTPAKKRFHMVFSTVMILLVTLDLSVTALWGEEMWIVHRDDPGGVPLFILTENTIWYSTLGTTCSFTIGLFGDIFLLYRLYAIFDASYLVVLLPFLTLIAEFVLTVIQIIIAVKPHTDFFHGANVDIGTTYWSISLGYNTIVTLLIVMRLRKLSRSVTDTIGHANAQIYTNVSAMLIESEAPYTLFGIAWIVPYELGHPTAVCFGFVSAKLNCLAPLLIILRVVNRSGWDDNIVTQAQSLAMQFHATGRSRATGLSVGDSIVFGRGSVDEIIMTEGQKEELVLKATA